MIHRSPRSAGKEQITHGCVSWTPPLASFPKEWPLCTTADTTTITMDALRAVTLPYFDQRKLKALQSIWAGVFCSISRGNQDVDVFVVYSAGDVIILGYFRMTSSRLATAIHMASKIIADYSNRTWVRRTTYDRDVLTLNNFVAQG